MEDEPVERRILSDEERVLVIFAYMGPLAIVALAAARGEFVKWHARQGLLLTGTAVVTFLLLRIPHSLLYLVSQSLEHGQSTPILGMEKYFNDKIGSKKLPNVHTWAAPGQESKSTTHGGFDDDQVTMASVIALIKGT